MEERGRVILRGRQEKKRKGEGQGKESEEETTIFPPRAVGALHRQSGGGLHSTERGVGQEERMTTPTLLSAVTS